MQEEFIVFGSPLIGDEEVAEVVACMESSWLGTGPRVARFEADFAAYQGVGRATVSAVNSCTAALHLALIAAGLEPGAERSEERRVGKECRSRWWGYEYRRKGLGM